MLVTSARSACTSLLLHLSKRCIHMDWCPASTKPQLWLCGGPADQSSEVTRPLEMQSPRQMHLCIDTLTLVRTPMSAISKSFALHNIPKAVSAHQQPSLKVFDRLIRSTSYSTSRRSVNRITYRGPGRTGPFLTLICAAGISPFSAYAATMSEAKTAIFAAVKHNLQTDASDHLTFG
jgi:hypothetical protein